MCRMNESVAEPHVEDVMGSVLPRMQFESHAQKKKEKKNFCLLLPSNVSDTGSFYSRSGNSSNTTQLNFVILLGQP